MRKKIEETNLVFLPFRLVRHEMSRIVLQSTVSFGTVLGC